MRRGTGLSQLSRRERQIMEIIFSRGRATAADVLAALPDPPSYSAVRALLRVLEEKGQLRHEVEGQRYVYIPLADAARVRRSALRQLVQTFFGGSASQAVATLIDVSRDRLTAEELDRLAALIEKAREEQS